MNFILFASFITFGVWLTFKLRKSRNLNEKAAIDFWENENMANSVRKKPLQESDFVCFPFETLPTDESFLPEAPPEALTILRSLSDRKMINLNGVSNTDVKKQYGTANLTILSEYDENFESFVKQIYLLCQQLYDAGRIPEAVTLLEEGITAGTDSLSHYRLLAKIYRENGQTDKFPRLRVEAEKLHSLTKKAILRELA